MINEGKVNITFQPNVSDFFPLPFFSPFRWYFRTFMIFLRQSIRNGKKKISSLKQKKARRNDNKIIGSEMKC
jgi:hypothetical protein